MGCEKKEKKYKQYKDKLVCKFIRIRKCRYSFKLKKKFVRTIWWKVTLECGFYNHKVMTTLLSHSYVNRLSSGEKLWLINWPKAWWSLVKFFDNQRSRPDKSQHHQNHVQWMSKLSSWTKGTKNGNTTWWSWYNTTNMFSGLDA